METRNPSALSRSRPIRVAYLVEESEASHPILDEVFTTSFGHWGGRFSLVIPCQGGEPRAAYMPWLEAYDPDVIYSYVDLARPWVQQIHDLIYPSALVGHEQIKDLRPTPRLPIQPLSAATIIPLVAAPNVFDGTDQLRLSDASREFGRDPFFLDNFGSVMGCLGRSLPMALEATVSLLTLSEPESRKRASPGIGRQLVSSIPAFLASFTEGRTRSLSQLSALQAPRLEARQNEWASSFNIVVGDTIVDRIAFWNGRFLQPTWRDGGWVDLRIPASRLEDTEFMDAIARFLSTTNRVSPDGGSGIPRAVVRSTSVDVKIQTQLVDRLSAEGWATYRVAPLSSVDDCVPKANAIKRRHFVSPASGIFSGPRQWTETIPLGDELHVSAMPPEHLRYAPAALQSPSEGAWAIEVDIARRGSDSTVINADPRWRLPRRLRMLGAFVRPYRIEASDGHTATPRVSFGGLITVFANSSSKPPAIQLPSDERAIRYAYSQGQDWGPFRRAGPGPVNGPFAGVRRSDAGRYFWGVARLFGGVAVANQFLLNRFWREQFALLGASSERTISRREQVHSQLKKRLPQGEFKFETDEHLDVIANIVLAEADVARTSTPTLTFYDFKTAHEKAQLDHWAKHPADGHLSPSEVREWQERERLSLAEAVRWLTSRGILHQGYETRCDTCFHRSWTSIDALKGSMLCSVCGSREPAPVTEPWHFRLNEFMREALRRHGVGAVFWAVSRAQSPMSDSLFFEGPLDVFSDYDRLDAGKPNSDIDLTIIRSGAVQLCEVKHSSRLIPDPRPFAEIAKLVRPEMATIAVMEPPSGKTRALLGKFSDALDGSGIQANVVTFDASNDIDDRVNFFVPE